MWYVTGLSLSINNLPTTWQQRLHEKPPRTVIYDTLITVAAASNGVIASSLASDRLTWRREQQRLLLASDSAAECQRLVVELQNEAQQNRAQLEAARSNEKALLGAKQQLREVKSCKDFGCNSCGYPHVQGALLDMLGVAHVQAQN